jgi:UDP-N-acetylmuramoylalanine--D-glutamate ligase
MKKVLVIGAGESGTGAALLAAKNGYQVLVSDMAMISPKRKELLKVAGIELEEGSHARATEFEADTVVKSPGIPHHIPLVTHFVGRAEVIDEIEFAYRYKGDAKVIGVTGSNGKTTTTLLIHYLFSQAGTKVGLAGNVGKSWAGQLANGIEVDYWVLELSSFQLEGLDTFRADISVITNITPDHLDRYRDFGHYAQTKLRLFELTQGTGLYWNEDPELEQWVKENPSSTVQFLGYGSEKENAAAWHNDTDLIFNVKHKMHMAIENLTITGKHNVANSMAAGLAGKLMGLRKESIRSSLESFENVEHRLEFVAEVQGVEYTNDSKSTNVNSAWYALDSSNKPLVWIAGGVDKGNDYDSLKELAKLKVKVLVMLGVDNEKLRSAFADEIPVIVSAGSMEEAVQLAHDLSAKGDQVLLSPVCASFDLFENYEDRGNQFKSCARAL